MLPEELLVNLESHRVMHSIDSGSNQSLAEDDARGRCDNC